MVIDDHTHIIWVDDGRDKGKCVCVRHFPSLQIRRIFQNRQKVESGDYYFAVCVVHRKKITKPLIKSAPGIVQSAVDCRAQTTTMN